MVDMFPFPRITGNTPEEKISSIVDYLVQFKEDLEFAFGNISADNLSAELVAKLNDLGMNIEKNKEETEESIAQVSVNTLTISDVVNSKQFKDEISKNMTGVFNINYETGYLEYALPNEEVE